MSKKEKLVKRFQSRPKDFTFGELVTLLGYFDYWIDQGGKTSGSRVIFRHETNPPIEIHKPHPGNTLKPYQMRDIIVTLKEGE